MIYKTFSFRRALLLTLIFAAALALILFALSRLGMDVSRIVSSQRLVPIYNVATDRPAVSLGINCAWGDDDLPDILAALDRYGVKATFFVVGDWCEKHPQSLRLIYDAGHELGSHSDTHPDMSRLDAAGVEAELDGCAEKIAAVTGTQPLLFRPPSGAYSNTLIETAERLGYRVIQWSVDTLDWKGLSAGEICSRVLSRLRRGDIVLLHCGAPHTAEALPELLEGIASLGLEAVPVSELIYHEDYTIDHAGVQHPAE